jgi:hypothetical protein
MPPLLAIVIRAYHHTQAGKWRSLVSERDDGIAEEVRTRYLDCENLPADYCAFIATAPFFRAEEIIRSASSSSRNRSSMRVRAASASLRT